MTLRRTIAPLDGSPRQLRQHCCAWVCIRSLLW